ncbi:DUF4382 domain-containing protein [Marinoscillum sp.]|uniref:DUF4382 domain-containing protein n=1 Tax=Marinoscillum sp. TaxID=2024838 RepID=UPI003BAD1649
MKLKLLTILMAAVVALASCDDTNTDSMDTPGTATMKISLVDDPATFDAVLIDVQGVEYKLDTEDQNDEDDGEDNEDETDSRILDDEGEWVYVDIDPTVYDILQLQNGTEAVLADVDIEVGDLEEVRLILGDNNKVVVDGDTLDMTVPSGKSSGLKVKVDGDIEEGADYELVIDFDAAKSIVHTGSGKYLLKPVIRVKLMEVDVPEYGAISGVVAPDSVSSVVYVIDADEDSVSTMPEDNGSFLVERLDAGMYSVVAVPAEESGLNSTSAMDVEVMVDITTELDTLKFTE